MGERRITKKERAFQLFSEGYGTSSPEVKALKMKGNTRWAYHNEWSKLGKPTPGTEPAPARSSERTAKKSVPLPGRELVASLDEKSFTVPKGDSGEDELDEPVDTEGELSTEEETEEETDLVEEEEPTEEEADSGEERKEKRETEPKPGIKPVDLSRRGKDGKKGIPTDIIGEGIWVTVNLSIKTFALYQIAASTAEETLTLGDFLDTCAEDLYRVRGKDLGLVTIGRK